MKALIVLAIVCLAGSTVADNDETSLLLGKQHLFESFCIDTANFVKSELKTLAQDKSAILFRQFFNEVAEIGDEVLGVQRDAVEKLANQLSKPDTPISNDPMNEDEVNRMIEKARLEIQRKAGFGGLVPAMQSAALAMLSTLNSAIFIRIAKARGVFDGLVLQKGILDNCEIVHSLSYKLEAQLQDAKAPLLAANQDAESQNFIRIVTLPTLRCRTTRNIVRLSAFCKIFRDARGSFLKMLGIADD